VSEVWAQAANNAAKLFIELQQEDARPRLQWVDAEATDEELAALRATLPPGTQFVSWLPAQERPGEGNE